MNIPAQIAAVLLGLLGGGLLLLGLGFLPYWQSLDPLEFTQLFSANVPLIAALRQNLWVKIVEATAFQSISDSA